MRRVRAATLWYGWPLLALAVFVSLQVWRMSVYDRMWSDLMSHSPRAVSPIAISELSSWLLEPRLREGANGIWAVAEARRIPRERPELLAGIVACAIALCILGRLGTSGLLAFASFRGRWLPYSLGLRQRLHVAGRALGSAWLWGLGFGVAVGAVTWWVGFDRDGADRRLIDGLMPTLAQLGAMGAAWCALTVMAALPFLPRAAAAAVQPEALRAARICPACSYPLLGLAGDSVRCPECGRLASTRAFAVPSGRAAHMVVARRVMAITLCIVVSVAILVLRPEARRWLRLLPQPSSTGWRQVTVLDPARAPQVIGSVYGQISFTAVTYYTGRARDGHWVWVVDWQFTPNADSHLPSASGELEFSAKRSTPLGQNSMFAFERFPFGTLSFSQRDVDGGVIVYGSKLIFPE